VAVALIDYGAGNLTSVRKGFAAAGADLLSPRSPAGLAEVAGIVVPGVGHFGATAALGEAWQEAILRRVEAGVPLLGICLGMQWLFDGSAEAPGIPGLGLMQGASTRLDAARPLKVPHVGWNTLEVRRQVPILDGIDTGASVYFTHSFAAPVTADCAATSTHGSPFAAVVQREHIAGVQFHPEKSGLTGIRMLQNFIVMAAR
jgi:imidazole glycerol-phosphate synthase subunit HisH